MFKFTFFALDYDQRDNQYNHGNVKGDTDKRQPGVGHHPLAISNKRQGASGAVYLAFVAAPTFTTPLAE